TAPRTSSEYVEVAEYRIGERARTERSAEGDPDRVEQRGEDDGDEGEVGHPEFERSDRDLGQHRGDDVADSVERHGQDEDHQLLRTRQTVAGVSQFGGFEGIGARCSDGVVGSWL